jgi:hypothetical protein
MNADSNNSGTASATPRQNEHSRYKNLTEAEFLAHEADLAKSAISKVLAELKANAAKAGDVKLWAHHYPWVTLGVAAATGFTLAAVATSGGADVSETEGEEAARQRLVRETAKAPYNSTGGGTKPKLGDSLLGSLFSLARTALEASLVSAIRTDAIERAHVNAQTGGPQPTATDEPAEGSLHSNAAGRF